MAGAFQKPSRLTLIACVAPHYWPDPAERADVAGRLLAAVAGQLADAGVDPIDAVVIDGPEAAEAVTDGDMAVVVPMSGAVQPWIEALAPRFRAVALWPAYVPGTLDHARFELWVPVRPWIDSGPAMDSAWQWRPPEEAQ